MTSGDNGSSVIALLESAGFVPSAARTKSASADHVSACVQPYRRVAPVLVPEGHGPSTHLAVALSLQHPFLRMPASSTLEQQTLLRQHSEPTDLVSFRLRAVEIMVLLSDALKNSEYEFWLPWVNENIRPIVAVRHIRFCREVSLITAFDDLCLWPAHILGLRMSGWAEPSSVLPVKVTTPTCDEGAYKTSIEDLNRRVIASMGLW